MDIRARKILSASVAFILTLVSMWTCAFNVGHLVDSPQQQITAISSTGSGYQGAGSDENMPPEPSDEAMTNQPAYQPVENHPDDQHMEGQIVVVPTPDPIPLGIPGDLPLITSNIRLSPVEVFLNGSISALRLLEIEGEYFARLRDTALVMTQTDRRFSVNFVESYGTGILSIVTGESYVIVGPEFSEMPRGGIGELSPDIILVDSIEWNPNAYKIENTYYFHLAELGDRLGFSVWAGDRRVYIETN